MPETPDPVARINALTTNARNTWFVLLGVLVFVSITLMGVQHIDFYGVDRATDLPLVNVSVPTWLFFYAAPLLITAVYGYFHLYLIRLWDALSIADSEVNGRPLGDTITPWLLADAALYLRVQLRKEVDRPATHRMLEGTTMVLNFLLAWAIGLLVLYFLWIQSMSARALLMTTISGLCLLASTFVGFSSMIMLFKRMRIHGNETAGHIFKTIPLLILVPVVTPFVIWIGYLRTEGTVQTLAPIEIPGGNIVEKPPGWLPHDIARKDFLAIWCAREAPACAPPTAPQQGLIARLPQILFGSEPRNIHPARIDPPAAFNEEWRIRRDAEIAALSKPRWSVPKAERPDFRGAILYDTFLTGANLAGAKIQEADLRQAQMEGANLFRAQMQEADLSGAQMQGANLREAQMEGAILAKTQMQGAVLVRAQMQGAFLAGAQMQAVSLWEAQMQGANFREAQMQGVSLALARMQGVELDLALLTGTSEKPNIVLGTFLNASINNGGALRNADLSFAEFDDRSDWRNAFFDGSVHVAEHWRKQIGQPCLWNWISENPAPLSDEVFFGRWRGWLTLNPVWDDRDWRWLQSVPQDWHDVTAIPPPPGCTWHSDPLPGTSAQQ